jgi:carbonic anhydrase/acetyltransferase-like protein (isoleucine patch superfamily)
MNFEELNNRLGGDEKIADWRRVSGGGWVHKGARVANEINVKNDAIVFGQLSQNAEIFGKAILYHDAYMCGSARAGGNARIFDKASLHGQCFVYEDAHIFGEAIIGGTSKVYGKSLVFGNAQVLNFAEVWGDAVVFGKATISGNTKVFAEAYIFGTAYLTNGYWASSIQVTPISILNS